MALVIGREGREFVKRCLLRILSTTGWGSQGPVGFFTETILHRARCVSGLVPHP